MLKASYCCGPVAFAELLEKLLEDSCFVVLRRMQLTVELAWPGLQSLLRELCVLDVLDEFGVPLED